jgi:uncharacterized protein (DUF362 family)
MSSSHTTRRDFLKRSIAGSLGLAAGWRAATLGGTARADDAYTATVAITKGNDRADNAFRALQMFKKDIAAAIGNKRVIVKPNFVYYSTLVSCTHVDWVTGVLEFLKSIGKTDVIIAESSATGSTMAGYDLNNYWPLTKKYPVKLADLNQEGFALAQIWYSLTEQTPSKTIRISRLYLNPNNFIISCPPMKTHNTAVVTLSMKNISQSAPVIDVGQAWSQTDYRGDKSSMHGPGGSGNTQPSAFQLLNDNVYRMAKIYGIHPHLAVIDGYDGMEGNGPVSGTALSARSGGSAAQHIGIVSRDWVAADRVALELMGTNVKVTLNQAPYAPYADMPYPACLNYAWQAGLGQWDLSMINVIGETIAANVVNYAANPNQSSQLGLRTTPREGI